jgi:hypothetical protein
MITGKKLYALVNIGSEVDPLTGDRVKMVTSGKKLVDNVELVGVNTAQLGQSQGFNLAYSVEIYRAFYNNEKYLYFDNNLYEIKSLSKAKEPTKMLLNVQKLQDADIKKAVEDWINPPPEEPEEPEIPPEEEGGEL